MKYKYLGSTKIKCPIIGFGGAPIGNLFKKLKDDEANQILKISQKNKINLYDTSPFYGYGLSEVRLGKFLKKIKKHKSFLKGSPKIIKISNKKITKAINYKISMSFKNGLKKTYNWYLNLI